MIWFRNKIYEHFKTPSLYLNFFQMIDIVCTSDANFVNVYIKWFKIIKHVIF